MKDIIRVNTIYTSFDGECNKFGIGAPTIFVRLQGCPLRCYKKTLGELCDTPEGLAPIGGMEMTPEQIVQKCIEESKTYGGIKKITLSGGDPLWREVGSLHKLLRELAIKRFAITVETSGLLSIKPYVAIHSVYWVLDYKLHSAGVMTRKGMEILNENISLLSKNDWLKFVIYDRKDYELCRLILYWFSDGNRDKFNIGLGLYYGTPEMTYLDLLDWLKKDGLLGLVNLNFQTHKLMLHDGKVENIPKEL